MIYNNSSHNGLICVTGARRNCVIISPDSLSLACMWYEGICIKNDELHIIAHFWRVYKSGETRLRQIVRCRCTSISFLRVLTWGNILLGPIQTIDWRNESAIRLTTPWSRHVSEHMYASKAIPNKRNKLTIADKTSRFLMSGFSNKCRVYLFIIYFLCTLLSGILKSIFMGNMLTRFKVWVPDKYHFSRGSQGVVSRLSTFFYFGRNGPLKRMSCSSECASVKKKYYWGKQNNSCHSTCSTGTCATAVTP